MKTLLIDKQRIRKNAAKIREQAGKASVYAVLKGDAYGLGLLEVAKILRDEGIKRYALTDVEDAVTLRKNGFTDDEILMLRSTAEPAYVEALAEYSLVGTIGSNEAAMALNGVADKRRTVIEAHIKVDCGMGRYGFAPSDYDKIASVYKYISNVALTGIYTHFPMAYKNKKKTREQFDVFMDVVSRLRGSGIEPGLVHAANSSALFRYDFAALDAVRVGSAFTGRMPTKSNYGLHKVGVAVGTVAETRWLQKGATVGYNSVFRASRPTRIAIIPVGYVDGFCVEKARDSYRIRDALLYSLSAAKRCLLRRRLYVQVGGNRARVIGHVGMLHTVVDVTNIDCAVGDLAVFEVNPMFAGALPRTYE